MSENEIRTDPHEGRVAAPVLGHSYDGISEYDNPLPGWWRLVFWASFVFAIGYWVFYHMGGPGKSETAIYQDEWKTYQAERAKHEAAEQASVSEDALRDKSADAAVLARGQAVFQTNCVNCHGPAGAGLVGANLTDGFQIHGKSRVDLYNVIREGVLEKAMPAWGTMLPHDSVLDVTAYVVTLRGKNIAGKAAEGAAVGNF